MDKIVKNNRNGAITYLRVLAMLGIFVDHAVSYMDIPFGAVIIQITNSFVLLFLLISGFLYGNRKITDFKTWYKKRCTAILIPFWIFLAVYFIVDAIRGNFNVKAILIYGFNLQGIFGTDNGPHTLWFLTLLFMCYALVPLLQKLKEKINGNMKIYAVMIFSVLIVQLILAFFTTLTLDFGHPISWYVMAWSIFAFGYFISDIVNQKGFTKAQFITAIVALPTSLVIRLVAYKMLDGAILYDKVIAIYANVAFNISLFVVVYFLYFLIVKKCGQSVQNNVDNKFIKYFDGVSYCFYVIHHFIICEVLNFVDNQYLFFVFSLILTIIFGHILKIVSDKAQKVFTK